MGERYYKLAGGIAIFFALILGLKLWTAKLALGDFVFIALSVYFAYIYWLGQKSIKPDEFVNNVHLQGFSVGLVGVGLVAMLLYVFLPPNTGLWLVVAGVAIGAYSILTIGILYSWWRLRQ